MHEGCFLSNQRVEGVGREDTKALRFFRGVEAGVEGVEAAIPIETYQKLHKKRRN